MAIASMTGFAREAGVTGAYQWAWELKTVNGRGLEVRMRTPPGFDALAEEIRGQVQKALGRGQCQVSLTVIRSAMATRVSVNEALLAELIAAIGRVSLPGSLRPASLDGLLAVRGVIEADDGADPSRDDALIQDLRTAAKHLILALQSARAVEGQALDKVLSQQIDTIEASVSAAEQHPARRPEAIKARLAAQIEQLLAGSSQLDPDRLHQEAVLIATRVDIREEIDRLRAHVESARALLKEGKQVGRRLDFLAQEFGRESNTLCAKANDVSLSRIGLDLKATVEQFREQVQNVE